MSTVKFAYQFAWNSDVTSSKDFGLHFALLVY